jgi:hypothetical protein
MTPTQDLARLSPAQRRKLLQFVTSFAWTDLEITAGEIAYVHRLVARLHLTPDEARDVEAWLRTPPPAEDVDPTEIPRAHREIFLGAVKEVLLADGSATEEEMESLALFEALTR